MSRDNSKQSGRARTLHQDDIVTRQATRNMDPGSWTAQGIDRRSAMAKIGVLTALGGLTACSPKLSHGPVEDQDRHAQEIAASDKDAAVAAVTDEDAVRQHHAPSPGVSEFHSHPTGSNSDTDRIGH